MDPNHWNTYNFQYGAPQGGLPPTHSSLAGLGLGHGLQGAHSSIGGRAMPGIPSVNYSGLSVPILDTMSPLASGLQPQQAHKALGEAPPGLMFDPQVRVSSEQLSPSLNRFDAGSKVLRGESLSRNQLLEAARVWGGTNFSPSSSLYNQYSAILPDMVMPSSVASVSSPVIGGNFSSSKSSQPVLQEPPPAHSSSLTARATSCQQRSQLMGDVFYSRSSESLSSTSLSHLSAPYSSGLLKDVLSSNQAQTSHGYLPSQRESEPSLSVGSQHQLYGSYANLAMDSHEFAQTHLTNDIPYEAVSPAPVPQETVTSAANAATHIESPSFSLAQFSEFANLAPEHAQALAEKFHDSDFRLKLDPMRGQHTTQDSLSYHQASLRQEGNKVSKEISGLLLPSHMSQQSSVFSHIPHSPSPHPHPPPSHSASIESLSSLQQQHIQSRPTVQAPADSTTKPKRVRNRKKKENTVSTTSAASAATNMKKPVPQQSMPSVQQPRHVSNLHMPATSQISTLSMPQSPHVSHHDSHHQPPPLSQAYMSSINSQQQYTNRDAQRAQTPSLPQNYSINEQQHQAYSHSPSPKIQNNLPAGVMMSPTFSPMASSRATNEKPTYKQQQQQPSLSRQHKKHRESSSSPNVNNNNVSQNSSQSMFISNIPNNPMSVPGYPSDPNSLMSLSAQMDSSSVSANNNNSNNTTTSHQASHMSRLSGYPSASVPQHHMNINHPSPQDSISNISTGNKNSTNKQQQQLHHPQSHPSSQQYLSPGIVNLQHSVADPRPPPQAQSPLPPPPPAPPQQQPMSALGQASGYDPSTAAAMMEDPSNQFEEDYSGQPFLEQLVGAQNPNFGQATSESEQQVMLNPTVQNQIQEGQQTNDDFRPTYHGEAVHEIHPVGPMCGALNDMTAFNSSYEMNQTSGPSASSQNPTVYSDYAKVEVEPMTLTYMPPFAEDEEFNHFSQLDSMTAETTDNSSACGSTRRDSFQDSFLSYLQGNKQETLSSVSSAAITKKPQLPKYIPEPKRPRSTSVTVLKKDPILLSDSEDISVNSSQGKDFLSALSDNENSSQKSESDKEGYTVQRTSDLAMKITLPKGNKKGKISTLGESALLSHNKRQHKDEKIRFKKRKGKYGDVDEDDYISGGAGFPVVREPSPPPVRTSIGRKAKDRILETTKTKRGKYAESGSSTEDEIFPAKAGLDSDKDYDSDKDPMWMPFDQDLKAGYDLEEKKKKNKRFRLRAPFRASPAPRQTHIQGVPSSLDVPEPIKMLQPSSSTPAQEVVSPYKVGEYLIEKKDLTNYDSYPIWRLEEGSMIHKYELVIQDGGVVRHKAVGTYSTWMKAMYNHFQQVKVNELTLKGKGESLLVQVLDEYQPKMPTDKSLLNQYEDDPLVEPFNVYLQVFISQALEPTFLKAILEMGESFYLDPLNEIDNLVDAKVKELAAAARWTESFQEALHHCPLMKELDRPNLKQACQACQNSSPPTIKSVLLSGFAYDRTLLTNLPTSRNDAAHEFMIGKVAAHFVRPYHSLYHFKYWLRTRCEAKVKVMKESNKTENLSGETILEKCLDNRNWVLQLFDSLKKLLLFNKDPVR